jgi:hypothetical protein
MIHEHTDPVRLARQLEHQKTMHEQQMALLNRAGRHDSPEYEKHRHAIIKITEKLDKYV